MFAVKLHDENIWLTWLPGKATNLASCQQCDLGRSGTCSDDLVNSAVTQLPWQRLD